MKTNQTMFNYSDDFGIGPAIELLISGNCDSSGGIFTSVGSSVIPVTNGDQLVCDRTLNITMVIPHTDNEKFASIRWMFMGTIANTLSQYCDQELNADPTRLTIDENKTVGMCSAKVNHGIGILYCSLYLTESFCKSGKDYGVSYVEISSDKYDAMHEGIEKAFRNMLVSLFRQELQLVITDINS